jgi:hypothetical protein
MAWEDQGMRCHNVLISGFKPGIRIGPAGPVVITGAVSGRHLRLRDESMHGVRWERGGGAFWNLDGFHRVEEAWRTVAHEMIPRSVNPATHGKRDRQPRRQASSRIIACTSSPPP